MDFVGSTNVKRIGLTRGKVALVDDRDFQRLSKHKWLAADNGSGNWYAKRVEGVVNGRKKWVYMHHAILGLPGFIRIDHRNGDGLDNQRGNLRRATNQQNAFNMKNQRHSSRFKGVSWCGRSKRWRVSICCERNFVHLGYFKSAMAGAWLYDFAALILFGEYARTNFKHRRAQ